jgi:2-polyprenyl-3-methyl-5-hydroxy-6-metoxy-1,4-benzoquinol methylase
MTAVDKLLQNWRIAKARPFLDRGARVLDIGSNDGALFRHVDFLGPGCLGIDPTLKGDVTANGFRLIGGRFPEDMPAVEPFDTITMLAVLEHFPTAAHTALAEGCRRFLKAKGKIVITVPSPAVDRILAVLKTLRLIDGMFLEEHHGYEVQQTTAIFHPPEFRLLCRGRFQLGVNNLFVFERG